MKPRDAKQYARAFYEVAHELRGKELTAAIDRFVKLLAHSGMIKKSERIINEFVKYGKKQEGIIDIEVTSAHELSALVLSHIKKVFGDKVEAEAKVNPELLGGVVVRTQDTILDGSLRTQLDNLKTRLAS